jgi:hypothetical protein
MSPEPADGTAIILHLIEAAQAIVRRPNYGLSNLFDPEGRDLQYWVTLLEERYARERIESAPAVGWEPRYWRELVAGDRVSLGEQEAEIASAQVLGWHVDPDPKNRQWHEGPDVDECRACNKGRCKKARGWFSPPLEHGYVAITLKGRDPVYKMPPAGEVETLRGPAGQAVDEANGFRSVLGEEEIDVMSSWAADAATTLEQAGLGPIEVLR